MGGVTDRWLENRPPRAPVYSGFVPVAWQKNKFSLRGEELFFFLKKILKCLFIVIVFVSDGGRGLIVYGSCVEVRG